MGYRFGYLGPAGTFGEQAALAYTSEAALVALPSNAAVVAAVESGEVDEGIAPTENSLEGSVNETVDAMLRAGHVFAKAELILPVEHNLIAAPGADFAEIAVVMSHPQALGQCRGFLESRLPHARLEAALSTAAAVAEAVRTPGAAAIGTRRAAEVHGGQIIAAGIQDVANNKTRFLVLGRSDAPASGDDKTSIAFSVPDRPGSLMEVLREFSDLQINLSRIESRPSREELGKYIFLIDFQGHRLDAGPAKALAAITAQGAMLLPEGRPLGSYPRYRG
jgi:prephenate dehydratase